MASHITESVSSCVAGRHCTVLGYGISNRPLCAWLVAHGAASLTVRDRRTREQMDKDGDLDRLAALGATVICGADYLADIRADLIFRTPGIRPDLPEIIHAVEAGGRLTSEMELFLDLTPATVIALSGSDGKTTTTTLTARIAEAAAGRTGQGRVYVGGNIGTPLLPLVEDMTAHDIAVVELSSFQLMTLTPGCVSRAALTNITPNHLNWHTDMAEYIAAKAHLLGDAEGKLAVAVLNARDEASISLSYGLTCPVVWFTGAQTPASAELPLPDAFNEARGDRLVFERDGMIVYGGMCADGAKLVPVLPLSRIRLPGRHNVENFMTAIALLVVPVRGHAPVVTPADVQSVADGFTGVAHRLELVAERDGIRYYNSSIDSSPARTTAALEALEELRARPGMGGNPPIVICGGQDKHLPFEPLARALCRHASAVVLTGEARGQIYDALAACELYAPERLPVTVISDYRDAMRYACDMASPGDAVLLSPACTSFDAFRNFEERGEAFRGIVADSIQDNQTKRKQNHKEGTDI